MNPTIIKVSGPRSYTQRIKMKGLKPEKKITVSETQKRAQEKVNIKRTLANHTTRLFVIEERLDKLIGRMSNDSNDLDTLYILKEQLYRRTNTLGAIAVIELLLILATALLWAV